MRKLLIKPDDLELYDTFLERVKVENYTDLTLPFKAMVWEDRSKGEPEITILKHDIPKKVKLWALSDAKEYFNSHYDGDPYFKVKPSEIEKVIFRNIYKGTPGWKPATDYVELLNPGQIAFTFGARARVSNPVEPLHTHIISDGSESPDMKIFFKRVLVARWDKLKNDYFLEINIYSESGGVNAFCYLPIPIPPLKGNQDEKGHKFWEKYVSNLFKQWDTTEINSVPIKDMAIKFLFKGKRKDSDFDNEEREEFDKIKKLFLFNEKHYGYTPLSVWITIMTFLSRKYRNNNKRQLIYGDQAKIYYLFNSLFFERVEHGWPLA